MKNQVRTFKKRRVVLLMILPMLFFNIGMSIITGSLWESVLAGEIQKILIGLLAMSAFGVFLASPALILFGILVEKTYVKGAIRHYWLFCVSAGAIGIMIYMAIVMFASIKEFNLAEFNLAEWSLVDLAQPLLIFIIHSLAAMLVYREMRKSTTSY